MSIGGDSNEYPQHMFLWRTGENYPSVIIKYPPYLFYWSHLVKWVVQSEKVNMNKTHHDGRWYEPRHDKPYLYHKQQRRRLAGPSEKSDQPYIILSIDSAIPVDYILEKCGADQLEYHLVANL